MVENGSQGHGLGSPSQSIAWTVLHGAKIGTSYIREVSREYIPKGYGSY